MENVPLALCLSGLIDDLLALLKSFLQDFRIYQLDGTIEEATYIEIRSRYSEKEERKKKEKDSSSSSSSSSSSTGTEEEGFISAIAPAAAAARGCPGVLEIEASAVRWAVRRSAGLLRHM